MQFTHKGKKIEQTEAPKWRNLSSGRPITRLHEDFYALKGYRFVGCEEDVKTFYQENKAVFNTELSKLLFRPFDDLESLISSELCEKVKAITVDKKASIRDIDKTLLKNLCPFTLHGLFTEALITSVHDGDTLNCAIILNVSDIATCSRPKGHSGDIAHCALMMQEGRFATVFTCRLFGIDAAELNTAAGKVQRDNVKRDLEDKYVWMLFLGKEKFGRELAVIYLDEKRDHIYLVEGAYGYLGGKKHAS